MSREILIIGEIANGTIKNATFECITKANSLAKKTSGEASLLILGKNLDSVLPEIFAYGLKKVYLLENKDLENYVTENFSNLICSQINPVRNITASENKISNGVNKIAPNIILIPATSFGKDLAPRIAANLKTALAGDCTEIEFDNRDTLIFTRPIFAGKLLEKVKFLETALQVATLRPKVFESVRVESKTPEVIKLDVPLIPLISNKRLKEIKKRKEKRLDVQEADTVVAGGRGLGNAENFRVLEELADVLGGAVGASRAAVDAGWRDHSCQVGQTGKTITPKLYIACGISGSMQHLAGMSSSRCVVAINKDPDAPILKKADYGIVGDLFKIVPLLIKGLKELSK